MYITCIHDLYSSQMKRSLQIAILETDSPHLTNVLNEHCCLVALSLSLCVLYKVAVAILMHAHQVLLDENNYSLDHVCLRGTLRDFSPSRLITIPVCTPDCTIHNHSQSLLTHDVPTKRTTATSVIRWIA